MHSRDGSKNASHCRERPNMEVVGKKLETPGGVKRSANKKSQGIQGEAGADQSAAPTTDR